MSWNSLFGRQESGYPDFSMLETDIHSHLIPGLDDGAQTLKDSMEMIRGLSRLGYKKLITTPHIMTGFAENTPATIQAGLAGLQQEIAREGIDIQVYAGAEYMIEDELPAKIDKEEIISFGNKQVLLEMSPYFPHPDYKSMFFNLQIKGYSVILAHAERYHYWFHDFSVFEELKTGGVLLQVNVLSFTGYYNPLFRKNAEKLAEAGMIDLLGTDLHRPSGLLKVAEASQNKYVMHLINSGVLKNKEI